MTYQKESETVLYRSKMNPTLKKNFALFLVLDWIAAITAHIPNKGEYLVHYYGYYSNVSRGERKKGKAEGQEAACWKPQVIEAAPPSTSRELKKRWSHFIPKVYETDPFIFPNARERCGLSN